MSLVETETSTLFLKSRQQYIFLMYPFLTICSW